MRSYPALFTARPPNPAPDPLLAQWLLWQRAQRLAASTIARRHATLQNFAEKISVLPSRACRDDILNYLDAHPQWTAVTAANYYDHLAAWFKWLVLAGHRGDNPMVLLTPPRRPRGEPRPLSDAELRRLIGQRMHHRTRVMIWLGALAGLRVSEIARVRGEHLDLSRRVIWVNGKGNTKCTVPLHPLLIATASTMPRSGFWFPRLDDPERCVNGVSVSRVIGRAMRRAGVAGTPHALRHWYGTSLLAKGADLRTVQACMRHTSVQTTQIYTRVPDDRRHEAVDGLDPLGGRWW